MRTQEITLYEFDELSEDVKTKVIEKFRNSDTFFYDNILSFELSDNLQEELKNQNIEFKNLNIGYSLGYSQGDGFNFVGNFKFKTFDIFVKKENHHYEHSRTVSFNVEHDNENVTDEQKDAIEKEFKTVYENICDKMEKIGYETIEDYQSDEYIKEQITNNEYEFLSDGTLW